MFFTLPPLTKSPEPPPHYGRHGICRPDRLSLQYDPLEAGARQNRGKALDGFLDVKSTSEHLLFYRIAPAELFLKEFLQIHFETFTILKYLSHRMRIIIAKCQKHQLKYFQT